MNAREALTAVGALRDAKIDSGSLARKQSRRLSQLVNHAYQRVPYYRKLFQRNRIAPDDVTSPDDLRRIPLTSRSDIQNLPLEARSIFASPGPMPRSIRP
jgi:phenylacetate-coenzyme A ligase PaaK-like adenylate-forming protein